MKYNHKRKDIIEMIFGSKRLKDKDLMVVTEGGLTDRKTADFLDSKGLIKWTK